MLTRAPSCSSSTSGYIQENNLLLKLKNKPLLVDGHAYYYYLTSGGPEKGLALQDHHGHLFGDKENIIVNWDWEEVDGRVKKHFLAFEDRLDFAKFYLGYTGDKRSFFEIIHTKEQKPFFDIDVKTKDFTTSNAAAEVADLLKDQVITSVKSLIPTLNVETDVLVYSSHCDNGLKYSYHIVFSHFKHSCPEDAKAFYDKVVSLISMALNADQQEYLRCLDPSVYSKNHQLRLLFSSKCGETRFKRLERVFTYLGRTITHRYTDADWDPEEPGILQGMSFRRYLFESMITQVEGCETIPSFADESKRVRREYHPVDDAQINAAIALYQRLKMPYEYINVSNGFIQLKNNPEVTCELCNRKHERLGRYLTIKATGDVLFGCYASRDPSLPKCISLGNIIPLKGSNSSYHNTVATRDPMGKPLMGSNSSDSDDDDWEQEAFVSADVYDLEGFNDLDGNFVPLKKPVPAATGHSLLAGLHKYQAKKRENAVIPGPANAGGPGSFHLRSEPNVLKQKVVVGDFVYDPDAIKEEVQRKARNAKAYKAMMDCHEFDRLTEACEKGDIMLGLLSSAHKHVADAYAKVLSKHNVGGCRTLVTELNGANSAKAPNFYVWDEGSRLWKEQTYDATSYEVQENMVRLITLYINTLEFRSETEEKLLAKREMPTPVGRPSKEPKEPKTESLMDKLKRMANVLRSKLADAAFMSRIMTQLKQVCNTEGWLRSLNPAGQGVPTRNGFLVNFLTKTHNETGEEIREIDVKLRTREHRFTQTFDCDWNPNSPRMADVEFDFLVYCCGDEKMRQLFFEIIGVCFSGTNFDKMLYILVGNGNNAKSWLLKLFSVITGPFGGSIPDSVIIKNTCKDAQSNGATNDLNHLVNKWFVFHSENNPGDNLNLMTLKRITGGDTIPLRALYSKSVDVTFNYCHIMLVANNEYNVDRSHEHSLKRLMYWPMRASFEPDIKPVDDSTPVTKENFFDQYPSKRYPIDKEKWNVQQNDDYRSAVFYLACVGSCHYASRNHTYTFHEGVKTFTEESTETYNPITEFVNESLIIDKSSQVNSDEGIGHREIYTEYKRWYWTKYGEECYIKVTEAVFRSHLDKLSNERATRGKKGYLYIRLKPHIALIRRNAQQQTPLEKAAALTIAKTS